MGEQTKVTGVILAGGLGRRVGGQDKGLIEFQGKPLISYPIAAMQPVVDEIIISANRNLHQYQAFGLSVISDYNNNFDGPLAGILAAMTSVNSKVIVVMPCDTPLCKAQHLQQLIASLADNDIAVASDGDRIHPLILAIKTQLRANLQAYLASGQRKAEDWVRQQNRVEVDFRDEPGLFINLNTQAEVQAVSTRKA